jgi:hypothetical protein
MSILGGKIFWQIKSAPRNRRGFLGALSGFVLWGSSGGFAPISHGLLGKTRESHENFPFAFREQRECLQN